MRISYRCLLVAFLALLLPCFSEAREFKTSEGFTIMLPDNWKVIPLFQLEKFNLQMQDVPQFQGNTFDYGFQLEKNDRWFAPPFILVQVKKMGHLAQFDLEKYPRWEELFPQLEMDLSLLQRGEVIYDEENKILWSLLETEMDDHGLVKGLMALVLTAEGFFQLVGFSKDEDFARYIEIFKSVALNVELNTFSPYQPQSAKDAASGGWLAKLQGQLGLYIAIILVLCVIVYLTKKMRSL